MSETESFSKMTFVLKYLKPRAALHRNAHPQPDVQSAPLLPFLVLFSLNQAKSKVRHVKVEFPVSLFFSHVNHGESLKWHSGEEFMCRSITQPAASVTVSPPPYKSCALCTLCTVCACVWRRVCWDDKTAEQMKNEVNIWTGHTRWTVSTIQTAQWRIGLGAIDLA